MHETSGSDICDSLSSHDEGKNELANAKHRPISHCLNCGTQLVGPHCHGCGQKVDIHRTIGAFLHDLVHGVMHFEGRAWRTLPLLAWWPGELTRRYIDGERTRFISPMALFLFSIFLMFAAFQLSEIASPADVGAPRVRIEASNAESGARGEPGRSANDIAIGNAGDGTLLKVQKTGWDWLDHGLVKWRDNPSLMFYKFQANSYKFSWALILISIPFVWLLFSWKRAFKGYDHAVFVTYSISFMTLLMIALSLLYRMGMPAWIVTAAAVIVPPVHLYKDLRGTYGLSNRGTLWRLTALLVFIAIIVALFLQMLWVIGIAS